MTHAEIKRMERELIDARRELANQEARIAVEREEAERMKRAKAAGITTLRTVEYKGERLEQITDGAAPYAVYCRRHSVVPWFVFREDGALICSCAFKKAALGAVEELNKLVAATTGMDAPVFFRPTRGKKSGSARASDAERELAGIDERLKEHEKFVEAFDLEAAVRNAGRGVA